MLSDKNWTAQQALYATQSECLQEINEGIKQILLGAFATFLSADSVDKAEVNELNFSVELFYSIACNMPLLDHTLTLKKDTFSGYFATYKQRTVTQMGLGTM